MQASGGLILKRRSTVRLLDCQSAQSMPNKWLCMSKRLKLIRIMCIRNTIILYKYLAVWSKIIII